MSPVNAEPNPPKCFTEWFVWWCMLCDYQVISDDSREELWLRRAHVEKHREARTPVRTHDPR